MNARRFVLGALAALFAVLSLSARAEDIDLFTGTRADETRPANLLLVIANAAHSSSNAGTQDCRIDGQLTALSGSALGVEQCALYSVISSLDLATSSVNLGIMMFNGTGLVDFYGNDCVGSEGGCLMYRLTTLTADTTDGAGNVVEGTRTPLLRWIKNWKSSGSGAGNIKTNSEATASVMAESWAYYYGRRGMSGRDYAGVKPNTDCKNFIVFIADALAASTSPGDGGSTSPKAFLEAAPGITAAQRELITIATGITPANTVCGNLASVPTNATHESGGLYADEWARYMHANRIQTYTVGFVDPTKCKPDYPWLLSSMASNGGGAYFPTTKYQELVDALNTILSEVRSVNSVFAAVSLPVSVNSQGTYLNQVFIGMFRPDPAGLPRWHGNLKQYKMGFLSSTGAFSLLDADNRQAISSSGSEFIGECARSFWTPAATTAGDGYWNLNTVQNCAPYPAASNSPDGNLVEKGGQGYMLRNMTHGTRVVKTCPASVASCTSLTSFDTSNGALTSATFSIPASTSTTLSPTAAQLVNWVRGSNNHVQFPEAAHVNGSPITAANMRPSSHGDVVHSRPAAINFGTDASPRVVVFYGGNDGMLRAINGNRTASISTGGTTTIPAGEEFWSFVPPEFYTKFIRRYRNGAPEQIDSSNRKDYAMDGPIAAVRRPGGDAWLFVGMRRGGRTLYAFDVDSTTLAITLKWKVGCIDGPSSNCNSPSLGDYADLGQTWSPPQVFTARGYDSGSTPLLIMGGGYDATCEDAASWATAGVDCSARQFGKGFYVLDADTGRRRALFPTDGGVVADVTIVPESDGHAKYIYGADLRGNVYRISGPLSGGQYQSIGNHPIGNWIMTRVANVGCDDGPATCGTAVTRKFMFAPDVVVDGSTYILLLGSGDREKPTDIANPVQNYFFMIKDRPDLGDAYLTANDGCTAATATLCTRSLLTLTRGVTPGDSALSAKKGWALPLLANEQVVTGAIAVFGTVYFTTHEPKAAASNACVPNLGTSRAYGIRYTNAAASRTSGDLFIQRDDAGLAPDLVVGKVTLDNNSTVPFCIGCDGPIKPSQPVAPGLINNPAKIRSYWYIQK